MRRLIAMLAATALIGGALAVGDGALAQGRGRGQAEARGNAQQAPRENGRDNEVRQTREPQAREPQARDLRAYPPEPAPRDERRTNAPPPQAYGPPPGYQRYDGPVARRGGYLPPEAGGGIVTDLGRYQLRLPPRGYAWVRVNGGFAMVSTATGQIFDIVPD